MSKTLDELRDQIEELAPTVDTPADGYGHNIISLCLAQIDTEFGTAEANKAIENFDLEDLGWKTRPVQESNKQTIVLKVSLTFDPKALVQWAKNQAGVCCDEPAHNPEHLDWMIPELTAQSILAHAFLSIVPDEIADGGSVEALDIGLTEYEASLAGE